MKTFLAPKKLWVLSGQLNITPISLTRLNKAYLGLSKHIYNFYSRADRRNDAKIDEIESYHYWQIGLHFEEKVTIRIQDLDDRDKIPTIKGQLQNESVLDTDDSSDKTLSSVIITNPSKGLNIIFNPIRSGSGKNYPGIDMLEPVDSAVANGPIRWATCFILMVAAG